MSRFAFAAVLGATAMASADFAGASYTEEVINPGEVTYKIFLNYTNPLDKQLAVSGNANFSALQLTASSDLIQKHLVPAVPADVPGPLAKRATLGSPSVKATPTAVRPTGFQGRRGRPGFLQADNGYFDFLEGRRRPRSFGGALVLARLGRRRRG